jgi:YVTN family beta-propeller protein
MPTGLALSPDGETLYVTCAAPASTVEAVDWARRKVLRRYRAGHTAMSPLLSPDGKVLYVCNRFNNTVSVIDLKSGDETARIPVSREPVSAAITSDGRHLLVANRFHNGRADQEPVAAQVDVIDLTTGKVVRNIRLPSGSGLLSEICISPDGRYACVTHLLSRFQLPTTQVERGWMNSNAFTIIDLATWDVLNTVLLDNVECGAANPWGCSWSANGRWLVVTHAGTHELSVIDFPGLLAKLSGLPEHLSPATTADYTVGSRSRKDVPSDLAFLVGLRERVTIQGRGPRAVVTRGSRAYVASYFSDDVEAFDLGGARVLCAAQARLSPAGPMSVERKGEFWFNDGTLCLQGWQSCASCHSDDGRVDALNWDLLNDGVGNPKNSKSMLKSHVTPPAMSLGVRDKAEAAVRAGIHGILFAQVPEQVPLAIDQWLRTLEPIPSPFLANGKLSAAAKRGEQLFSSPQARCAQCHPKGLFTDMHHYDVGTQNSTDKPGEAFDTPTLLEIWRTAPYLHDGSAATLREVIVDRNPANRHGHTSKLKPTEIDDLVAYLLSL